jgi:hypothetical protein
MATCNVPTTRDGLQPSILRWLLEQQRAVYESAFYESIQPGIMTTALVGSNYGACSLLLRDAAHCVDVDFYALAACNFSGLVPMKNVKPSSKMLGKVEALNIACMT